MANPLVRWDPYAEVSELRSRLDQLLEGGEGPRAWTPRVDLVEREGRLLLRADIPGVKPEDVDVEVSEGVLTISGRHSSETEEKDERYVRRERRFGSFSRQMPLPDAVSPEDISASCQDGVLEVEIPIPQPAEGKTVRITPRAESG